MSGAIENAIDCLVQIFCLKTRELSAEKQNMLLSECVSTASSKILNSTRDDATQIYKADNDAVGRKNRNTGTG
jgi:hypothetical protein